MRRGGRGADERGSGTAIGVAVIFPILMLVIVVINLLTETSRIEQNLQATANRAARTASLCCHATGGTGGAAEVVNSSLTEAESVNVYNRVFCNNDFVGDSRTVFIDVNGQEVAIAADNAVPTGGTVYVFLRCVVPPQNLGGFALPGLDIERSIVGIATIDPYRYRSGA